MDIDEKKELKNKVESLLFSAGKRIELPELVRLTKKAPSEVKESIESLKEDYNKKDSSLMLIEDNESYKLAVREKYLNVVKKVVTETELTKTMIETLAVIAWKAPVMQSDVIKIRTNKAYDHVKELEADGYITRTKKGRSMLIRLAQKFHDYFDVPKDRVHEKFDKFTDMEKAIEEKEHEIEEKKKKIKDIEDEHRRQKDALEKSGGLDLDDLESEEILENKYVEVVDIPNKKEQPKTEIVKEKLGSLDVVDEPVESAIAPSEDDIDKRADEMVGKEKAEQEEESKDEESEQESEELEDIEKPKEQVGE